MTIVHILDDNSQGGDFNMLSLPDQLSLLWAHAPEAMVAADRQLHRIEIIRFSIWSGGLYVVYSPWTDALCSIHGLSKRDVHSNECMDWNEKRQRWISAKRLFDCLVDP